MEKLGTLARRYPLWFGFGLMFLFTWTIELAIAAQSHGMLPFQIHPLLALCVGYGFVLASLLATALQTGKAGVIALLKRFLIWRVGIVWYLVAILSFGTLDLIALGLDRLLGGAEIDFGATYASQIFGPEMALWAVFVPFFLVDLLTNGEEIGWRGYALPRLLERYSALIASLVIGAIWAVWHLPKFLTAGSAHDYPFIFFIVDVLAKAVIFTWLAVHTRHSLLLASLMHAAINTSAVFLPLMPHLTGELRPLLLSISLKGLFAIALVVYFGPRSLSRPAKLSAVHYQQTT
jgi:membrane protease YdiL (CAAX protease family)